MATTISKLKSKCLQERMNVYANSASPEACSVRLFQKKTPQKRCRVYSAFDCSQEAQERKMQNLFWIDISSKCKRSLAPDPHGPFCISIFSKDIKDHKTQDTQTTILPISAIFLVLKVFSCSLLLFCLLLCVTFH